MAYWCNPFAQPAFLARVRGIIFDCDGVLVDSQNSNSLFYNLIRKHLQLPPIGPEDEDYVHSHSVCECLKHIIPADRLEEAEAARRELDYADIFPAIVLEEGLIPLLEFLARRGIRMAVNTNRTNTTERLLDHFGIARFFTPVINAGGLSHPKPNPEGVHRILTTWDMPREDVAYIGDSIMDERTARAARVPFWAYKNPRLLAMMHIAHFDDLRLCLVGSLPGEGIL